jgi:hypothetical protein
LIITIYVDDLIIVGPNIEQIARVKEALSRQFHITDMGNVSTLLGMEIEHFKDYSILLHQLRYVDDVIKRFRMAESKPSDTPMSPKISISDTSFDIPEYQRITGLLI